MGGDGWGRGHKEGSRKAIPKGFCAPTQYRLVFRIPGQHGEGLQGERTHTCHIGAEELRNRKIIRTRDYGRAGAGEEIRAEPALIASHGACSRVCANKSDIRFHAHELVLDGYLQTFDARGSHGFLHLR